jgi:hypothetical protein
MTQGGLVLEIRLDAQAKSAPPSRSRVAAFLEGFARAFDPAPVEPVNHFIRDDAAAMRRDMQAMAAGFANYSKQRVAG